MGQPWDSLWAAIYLVGYFAVHLVALGLGLAVITAAANAVHELFQCPRDGGRRPITTT